ncbi:unnamed protein product [Cylicocyclus nassatus]|uniref:Uncharacterized protein n=1 Tax=Cylicocyclus nassatus TaxID=53992 RepID=A0AA36GXM4_CYLNA|nr:unnamed protein product [Cylicocyclus nassatus]
MCRFAALVLFALTFNYVRSDLVQPEEVSSKTEDATQPHVDPKPLVVPAEETKAPREQSVSFSGLDGLHNFFEGLFKLPLLEPITLSSLPNFFRSPQTADYCIPKLKREFKENNAYFHDVQKQVEENNIAGAYDVVFAKAREICTVEQVERMKALDEKYATIKQNVQTLAPVYNKQTKDQVLQWLRDDNFLALSGFLVKESLANMHNATLNSKLTQTSLQLGSMQFDQFLDPI